jgi:hypothetical protein
VHIAVLGRSLLGGDRNGTRSSKPGMSNEARAERRSTTALGTARPSSRSVVRLRAKGVGAWHFVSDLWCA